MKEPVSKFDEPDPGAVSGVWARQMFEDWNSVKQLATNLGLYAATFFVLAATRLARCLWWRCPLWALPLDATAPVAATLPLVFDNAATAGPAVLVPGVFEIAFAALSVIFAFRKRISLSGRPEVVPLEDDQDLDENEADHNVWNDLLRVCVHDTIAPLLVPLTIPLNSPWPCPATLL